MTSHTYDANYISNIGADIKLLKITKKLKLKHSSTVINILISLVKL